MSSTLLAELNAYRADAGLEPLKTWKNARNMPMLEQYRAGTAQQPIAEPDTIVPADLPDTSNQDEPVATVQVPETVPAIDPAALFLPVPAVTPEPVATAAKPISKKLAAFNIMARPGGATVDTIATELGISTTAARSLIGDLRRDGQNIVSKGKGVFSAS